MTSTVFTSSGSWSRPPSGDVSSKPIGFGPSGPKPAPKPSGLVVIKHSLVVVGR